MYWIHSRAINAFDATSTLIWSWALAVNNLLADGYTVDNVVSMLTSITTHDTEPNELMNEVQIQLENISFTDHLVSLYNMSCNACSQGLYYFSCNTSREYGQATITQIIS